MQVHNVSSQELENNLKQKIGSRHKLDKYFYNCIISLRKFYRAIIFLRVSKPIVYVILVSLINYFANRQNKFWIFMYIELAFLVLLVFQTFYFIVKNYTDSEQNNLFFMQLGKIMGHAVLNQPIPSDNDYQSLQKCISQTKQNVIQENSDPSYCSTINTKAEIAMKVYTRSTLKLIIMGSLEIIDLFLIWGMIIYLIVKKVKGQFSQFNQTQIKYIIVILAINPLNTLSFVCLCISLSFGAITSLFAGTFYLFYQLYHKIIAAYIRHHIMKKRMRVRQIQIRPTQTQQQLEISCSICLLDFKDGQNVGQLQCPSLHIFHIDCVKQWLNRMNTCPLCRFQIYDKLYTEAAISLNS